MKYSFKKGATKTMVQVLVIGVPLLIGILPEEWMNLTLGGLLSLLVNWAKVRYFTA